MDSLREPYSEHDTPGFKPARSQTRTSESVQKPLDISTDERRMHVRAYNFWASMLGGRTFPPIDALDPGGHPDFGPNSVLLDFTQGIETPRIAWIGAVLAQECDVREGIETLGEVTPCSLLTRITDHYLQILSNQAPIGFEAEFVNHRGTPMLYRGILLPFAGDDCAIGYLYGVINGKVVTPHSETHAHEHGLPDAMEPGLVRLRPAHAMTGWADGPADPAAHVRVEFSDETSCEQAPVSNAAVDLADRLALARDCAMEALACDARSRIALYASLSHAHDFARAAQNAPHHFAELAETAGVPLQSQFPFRTVVRLVFGTGYDKTRLAEFATVLSHARRLGLAQGALEQHIVASPGGIKGLVRAERAVRREEQQVHQAESPAHRLHHHLRGLQTRALTELIRTDREFTVLIARKLPSGDVVLVGETEADDRLLRHAARHLIA